MKYLVQGVRKMWANNLPSDSLGQGQNKKQILYRPI